MKAVDLVCSTAFMMGAALVISLATNFSGALTDAFADGGLLNSETRSSITIFLLAAMMTVTLSRIPVTDLNLVTNWRSATRAVLLGLVFASVIPLAGYYILNLFDSYEAYAPGLVFIAAAPFAASVGPLSFILRGDLEHALRSTIIVYVVALAWIPFIVWITLGETVEMWDVVKTVIEIIGIPLVFSRLLTKVKIDKTLMAVVLNCVIAVLVYLSVSAANFQSAGITVFAMFAMVAVLRDFGLGSATEVVEKRCGISWSTRVTDILMISYKNKGIAIALCVSLLSGPAIGNAMVAVAASIVFEVIWVAFMDSVLFSKKRMERELAKDSEERVKQTWS